MRSVVFHAHFYQPPREDPWLEQVEREPTAAPYHDWNRRIEQECYRAVVAARIPAPDGRIARLVNTLESISFNVGARLAEWLTREAPDTWNAILAADRVSRARRGHGNAIAMPYNHLILPLASRRDKITEVRWGMADFRRRFGHEPVGMWLPETAADMETLDVLAGEGIRFTILAPRQVMQLPPAGLPGLIRTSSGHSIAVFVYDGVLSHEVAFGPLIRDAERWTYEVLIRPVAETGPTLVSLAADGETFGHHHPFGEMALAATLERLSRDPEVRLDNFASFLARHPAEHPVELIEPSSWSCAHGVERWRSDCGCQTRPGTSQAWRAPLRAALDWLAEELHARFEAEGAPLLKDPWEARNAWMPRGPSPLPVRARELLEMEVDALAMFTSCGWFFDDIGGLETRICLRHAARAIEATGEHAEALHAGLRARLEPALSNDPASRCGMPPTGNRSWCPSPICPSATRRPFGPGSAATSGPWCWTGPKRPGWPTGWWTTGGPSPTRWSAGCRTIPPMRTGSISRA
jgi:alpha-amylase/alpha-mannosidase (GH57 family)